MTGILDLIRSQAGALPPLAKFGIVMAIIVCVPSVLKRAGLPAVVGLLLSGVAIGPYGLDLFANHRPVADFAAELGKLLLMFFCGLEIDLVLFRRVQGRSIKFGLLTTLIPLGLGTMVGFLFGYGALASIVLGSLLASHTLLGSSIVKEVGVTRTEPVTVTIGATVFSDTLSLIIFAICVSTYKSGFSVSGLAVQLLEIAAFFPLLVFGLSGFGAFVLKKFENDEDAYFVLILAILSIAGILATIISLPDIVGAFLAGLSVNAVIREKPAKKKLEFVGHSVFVPIFFIVTGFLIDPIVFYHSITGNFALAVGVILALIVGKWISATIAAKAFGYSSAARLTMWSLTLPQVAATLAATLVAYQTYNEAGERLLDKELLNVVLVLMLTTSVLGPILTARFAPRMLEDEGDTTLSPA